MNFIHEYEKKYLIIIKYIFMKNYVYITENPNLISLKNLYI